MLPGLHESSCSWCSYAKWHHCANTCIVTALGKSQLLLFKTSCAALLAKSLVYKFAEEQQSSDSMKSLQKHTLF